MESAVIYVRLTLDHEQAPHLSARTQCRCWCADYGLVVRTVHADRGLSGYADNVQLGGFDEALAAVVNREVSTLLVSELDRR